MNRTKVGKHALKNKVLEHAAKYELLRMAMIEITDSCNFRCGYCYVHNLYKKAMCLDDYVRCINELSDMGCMYLIITGGEPLLHADFFEMYKYAYNKIQYVSVFTNASLISDEHIELFKKNPPYEMEITLYGVEAASYDEFVGCKGMFTKFENALDLLDKNNIEYSLKTVINRKTIDNSQALIQYAKKRGVDFRYDTIVVPRIDGKTTVLDEYRMSAKDAVDFLLSKDGFVQLAKKEMRNMSICDNHRYLCDAALNSIFVDANLNMSYCVLVRNPSYNLKEEGASIKKGQGWLIAQKSGYYTNEDKCFDCELKKFCRYCPGRFAIETGSENIPSEWHCEFARILLEKIAADDRLD